jgi:hypothetical protein
MKNINRQLVEKETDNVLNLTLKDKTLISETGKSGKLKTTEKAFSDLEDAQKNFYKKEWEALKKGFILNNDNAKIGEPILHKFIGGGYTGSLSFQQTPKGIFVYKNDNYTEDEKLAEYLLLIDNFGNISEEITLPYPLVWNIEYRPTTNSLILDIDHFIFEYKIENKSFNNLGNNKQSDSFLSVSKELTAFATNGEIYIIDNQNNALLTINYNAGELYGGHTPPFCGKLSKDGKLLAFHNKAGEIQIIDTFDGKTIKKIVGDFELVEQMVFAKNNNLLVVQEQYGTWGMRYFDLAGCKEIKIDSLKIPEYSKDVSAFCFNADQSKLVLVQRANAHIFDFNAQKLLHSFEIEHVVKTCCIKFAGENLGVRTDYGCFSIYNV